MGPDRAARATHPGVLRDASGAPTGVIRRADDWLSGRLDDGFPEHPKVQQVGGDAAWLHVCALAYCNRNLTDGFIAAQVVGRRAAQFALLLLAGAALRLSWAPAGLLMQGFFLGNLLPMMAVAGQLYADSPVRICNAYLLDDQARLGEWLIALACVAAVGWLAQVARTMVLREERVLAAENPPILQN